MKFAIQENKKPKKDTGNAFTCLDWRSSNVDFWAARDDKTLVSNNTVGKVSDESYKLEANLTYLSCFRGRENNLSNDCIAATSSDGMLRFLKTNGSTDHKVLAHDGAAICVKWNLDGTSLGTSGEDGEVKIWSRSGNLRTKLATYGQPVHSICWGPDNNSMVMTNGNKLSILRTQGRGKALQWEVQQRDRGIILDVDWNTISNLIICGGEDCCYHVFDSCGVRLYQSEANNYVITSVSWRPNGTLFAVGSYKSIRLCDRRGWTYSQEQLMHCSSVLSLSWSPDGSHIAWGGGLLMSACLVDRVIEWNGITAKLVEEGKITILDNNTDGLGGIEDIEFGRETIVEFSIAYSRLVVCTTRQCHIYSLPNIQALSVLDLDISVNFIATSANFFALVDKVKGILVYSYDGRQLPSPRFQGLRADLISRDNISISPDTVAIIDHADKKTIRLFDVATGRPIGEWMGKIKHDTNITKIALSQSIDGQHMRRLAFVDEKKELHISPVVPISGLKKQFAVQRMGAQIDSIAWNDKSDILTAITDSRMVTWLHPNSLYVDKDLFPLSTETKDGSAYGKCSEILSFNGSKITVIVDNGALVTSHISQYPILIHDFVSTNRWTEAVQMCRFVKKQQLWATLASLSIQHNELETAKVAFSAIKKVDKLQYINYICSRKRQEVQNAELLVYKRCPDEAVSILLQSQPPLVYRAIKINIRIFRWECALQIAIKRDEHVDTVLWYRKQYLREMKKDEDLPIFQKYFSVFSGDLDEERIKASRVSSKKAEIR